MAEPKGIALSNRFAVTVDDVGLGSWSKVDGLDASWDLCDYRMGDAFNDRVFFPGNTKYTNVKLARAACADSKTVRDWLSKTTTAFVGESTMNIELRDHKNLPVIDWTLMNVMPIKWSIAGMDAGGSKIAIETLEIAHVGFEELKDRLGG